jgi:hypothetical protein
MASRTRSTNHPSTKTGLINIRTGSLDLRRGVFCLKAHLLLIWSPPQRCQRPELRRTEEFKDNDGDFVMVAFSGSIDAEECAAWADDEKKAKYIGAMQNPYPGIGQKIRRTEFLNWPSQDWTKASYYFPRQNEVIEWGPFWRAGYGGWLHFAGEHTSYAFMGYMEGALGSGYRLARRLAVRDKLLPA